MNNAGLVIGTDKEQDCLLYTSARGPMIDTITILLGLTVGASTQASEFLTIDSILIFALGALSFIIATCLLYTSDIGLSSAYLFLKDRRHLVPPSGCKPLQIDNLPVSYTHLFFLAVG